MRFKGLDLNILLALDVLLEERHVSRTAERLNVTQPAMSGILTRLREYFNDPILVQHGKRMIPTAHALALIPQLKKVLSDIDVLVAQLSHFDLESSERNFKIIASDYVVSLLFPRLAQIFSNEAHNLSIEFTNPSARAVKQFEQGEIDLWITPEFMMNSNDAGQLIYQEEQVVIGCAEHPALQSGVVSQEDFLKASHVSVELGGLQRLSYVEGHLLKLGIKRQVAMRAPSFLAAINLVKSSQLLTITHKSLALMESQDKSIAIAKLPFDIPPMKQMLCCHDVRENDLGVQWLIDEILKAGKVIQKAQLD